jgi:hypothetical protein
MKATYRGPEIAVEVFGLVFPRGMPIQVPDDNDHARRKLSTNPQFECDGGSDMEPSEPKRRGRPPKEQEQV